MGSCDSQIEQVRLYVHRLLMFFNAREGEILIIVFLFFFMRWGSSFFVSIHLLNLGNLNVRKFSKDESFHTSFTQNPLPVGPSKDNII